ncbi:hypothetical protein CPT_Summit_082 [Stenotrophomonas phage Summit]|nr:hypothetical protein CPT_Summit_082 [Stenotrophomonas phage Summit]
MKFKPQKVSDVMMAFPGELGSLLPPLKDIPAEYKDPNCKLPFFQFMGDWFYSGVTVTGAVPADGIDPNEAVRHVKCIMGSYEPKHEHKMAAIGWLMSLWFKRIVYKKKDGTEVICE